MQITNEGVIFISQFEGFRSKPYADVAGIPTIGYGCTHYLNGAYVKLTDNPIDKETGLAMLKEHISKNVEPYLNKTFNNLKQNNYDSLCSFCYNCGTGAFDKSSLKKAIINNAGADEIKKCFLMWSKAGGVEVAGLLSRRNKEADLYNGTINIY